MPLISLLPHGALAPSLWHHYLTFFQCLLESLFLHGRDPELLGNLVPRVNPRVILQDVAGPCWDLTLTSLLPCLKLISLILLQVSVGDLVSKPVFPSLWGEDFMDSQ